MVKTQYPEVKTYLDDELLNDPYIASYIKNGNDLYVAGRRNVMFCQELPFQLQVWIEARDNDARELLRTLPKDNDLSIEFGNPFSLRLVQDELKGLNGTVKQNSIFCMVDQRRFRPVSICPVKKLDRKDRSALQRYPASNNRDVFFQFFDDGKMSLYGSYKEDEIVGYSAVFYPGNTATWVHVRPEFRGLGYGCSLLSVCTNDLLSENEIVYYYACMDEMANLRTCLAVGFVPLREMFCYQVTRNQ